jgi:uncharacterized protein (DUF58 family)
LELVSRKVFRGRTKGDRRSHRKGQSVEFSDYRNYVPGDDLRFIDWNLYARLERLFLKVFLEEEDLQFFTLVDTSDSMAFGNPTKLQYARQLAAALGFIGLCRADRVTIEALSDSLLHRTTVFRGRASLGRMLDHLCRLPTGVNVPLETGLKHFCLRHARDGIVVLITDLMDKSGYEAGLRYLLARNVEICLVHVLAREELEPDLRGDLELVDCEDADLAEITVSKPLLDRYRTTLAAFLTGIRGFCTHCGISYLLVHPGIPIHDLVAGYLRHRGLVR